jgi:hypothetical protein
MRKFLISPGNISSLQPFTQALQPFTQTFRVLALLLLIGWAFGGFVAGAPDSDPLAPLLGEEDYEAARHRLREAIRRSGRPACAALGAYGRHRIERVREHAVRALADFGCETLGAYAPYLADGDPWVVHRLVRVFEAHRIGGAVPFLIRHLDDRRRLISAEGSWTIGEAAHRALRAITCQSFHFDPEGSASAREEAVRRWRDWYERHRDEPRSLWEKSGITRAIESISRDDAPHRREGLELLVLIGGPGLPLLRDAVAPTPEDLSGRLTCRSESPRAIFEIVPCLLEVRNISERWVALLPGDPEVRVRPETGAPRPGDGSSQEPGGRTPAGTDASRTATSMTADSVLERLVDLAPGEVLRRQIRIGPVERAGLYRITVALADAAAWLTGHEGGSSPGPSLIVAETTLRFYAR